MSKKFIFEGELFENDKRVVTEDRLPETNVPTKVSELENDTGYVTSSEMEGAIAAIPTPDVSGQIAAHDMNTEAHADIRQFVTDSIAQIPTPDVSGQINAHNTNQESHSDIRASIDSLSSEIANLKAVSIAVISGESEPDSTLGEDGDVYLVTG